MKIISEAPTRVDIGGGTLDLVPVHRLLTNPITVNMGVTLPAQVTLEDTKDREFEIISEDQNQRLRLPFERLQSDEKLPLLSKIVSYFWSKDLPSLRVTTRALSPAGAGLGGSSCLGVALMGALAHGRAKITGEPIPGEHQLVQSVQDVETEVIKVPTGCQDYWGAVRGGLNLIEYPPGATRVTTLTGDKLKEIDADLILCYSGKSRASGRNNWEIFRRVFDGEKKILDSLEEIGRITQKMAAAAREGQWGDVIGYSEEEWQVRKSLWPEIVTVETEGLTAAALNAGARFARVCGAGGGGVMAIFAPPAKHAEVKDALARAGGKVLPAGLASRGLTVQVST